MASQKISDMTAVTTLAGTEVFPLVQSSVNKKSTLNQIFSLLATVPIAGDLTVAGTITGGGSGATTTLTNSANSAHLKLDGTLDSLVRYARSGAIKWEAGIYANAGYTTDYVIYNETTSTPTIRINNTSNEITLNGQLHANVGLTVPSGTGFSFGPMLLYSSTGVDAYLRDVTFGRMHVTFNVGANVATSSTVFNGAVTISGQLNAELGNIRSTKLLTLSSAVAVDGPSLTSGLIVARDTTNGGTCVIMYESGNPVIVSQYGVTTFVVGAPGANQIGLINAVAGPAPGVSYRASAGRDGAVLSVLSLISQQ